MSRPSSPKSPHGARAVPLVAAAPSNPALGEAGGCSLGACGQAMGIDAGGNYAFAGSGQGDWIQETTYKYVGHGAGEFGIKAGPASAGGINWCCYIAGGTFGLLMLGVVIFILVPVEPPATTTPPAQDCNAAFASWKSAWSQEKKRYCCDAVGRGCPEMPPRPAPLVAPVTPAPPNRCQIGGVGDWAQEKKDYCCEHYNNGCDTPEPEPVRTPYDCVAGLDNWAADWSVGKKVWCCANGGRGCQQAGGGTTADPYDCNAGFQGWVAGWAVAKKEWCCSHVGKGCVPKVGGCA